MFSFNIVGVVLINIQNNDNNNKKKIIIYNIINIFYTL